MRNIIFGNKLKFLRMKFGMTQSQLADILGVSASTIGMYEQGRREPDNRTLIKLCKIFNTKLEYLFGINDNIDNYTEIKETILNFITYINSQEKLIFNGRPITDEERKTISDSLKIISKIST